MGGGRAGKTAEICSVPVIVIICYSKIVDVTQLHGTGVVANERTWPLCKGLTSTARGVRCYTACFVQHTLSRYIPLRKMATWSLEADPWNISVREKSLSRRARRNSRGVRWSSRPSSWSSFSPRVGARGWGNRGSCSSWKAVGLERLASRIIFRDRRTRNEETREAAYVAGTPNAIKGWSCSVLVTAPPRRRARMRTFARRTLGSIRLAKRDFIPIWFYNMIFPNLSAFCFFTLNKIWMTVN